VGKGSGASRPGADTYSRIRVHAIGGAEGGGAVKGTPSWALRGGDFIRLGLGRRRRGR
jgi:hypothetical protein